MKHMILTGRLGFDCRLGEHKGTPVVNFSVSAESGYGNRKATDWVNCDYWGKPAASVAPYLLKGTQVAVAGEWKTEQYDRKDGGGPGFKVCLKVSQLTLLARPAAQQDTPAAAPPPAKADADDPFGDEIPF